MLKIGFASKYYTLWEVFSTEKWVNGREKVIVTEHNYIKNISMSKETAMMAFPEAGEPDETLKGHSRSFTTTTRIYDVNLFDFGKYANMRIDECTDYSYLMWYMNATSVDGQYNYIANLLESKGLGKVIDGKFISNEEIERIEKSKEACNKYVAEYSDGKEFKISTDHNPTFDGYYRVSDNLVLKFKEVRRMEYRGYEYFLPVINGKSKRIKGKDIIIKKYSMSIDNDFNEVELAVEEFEIAK